MKANENKFTILVLYVDYILLVANDSAMLYDDKVFISMMKDMDENSYVIGI